MRFRIVVVLLAVLLGLTGCNLQPNDRTLPGQTAVGDDGYTVTVYFDEVANLVPNSTVQMDNVVVGTVASIKVVNWKAKVKLRLLKKVPVPASSTFSIGQKTLLGAQFVELSQTPHTDRAAASGATNASVTKGRMLRDGDVINTDQTGTYPATEQVLGAVALLLNNGGLSQIHTITTELATALENRVPDTRGLVRRTNQLLVVLDENRGQVVAALESLDRLSAGLASDRQQLGVAIDRLAPGLRTLESERVRLVRAVTETGRLGADATKVINASQSAILANLQSLRPILANLSKVSGTLPAALKIGLTIPFPAMTTTNALKGDYANLFTTLDLRLGSLANSWFGGVLPTAAPTLPNLAPPTGAAPAVPDLSKALPGSTPTKAPTPAGKSSTPAPKPTKPAPTASSCLLGILGVC